MRLRAVVDALRILGTRGVARRAAWVAGVALLERLLAPVVALSFTRGYARWREVLATLLFGAAFTGRSFLQRAFLAENEAELHARTATSLLDGDVLREAIPGDRDASAETVHAVHVTAQTLAQTAPVLCADAAACVLLGGLLAVVEPAAVVGVAAGAAVLAMGALFVARRAFGRGVERARRAEESVYDAFTEVLGGRLEIVAAGRRVEFREAVTRTADAWGAAGVRLAAATVLSGRLAFAAVAGLVALALVASARLRGALEFRVADLALFASATPAFVGGGQAVYALVRDAHWPALVARTLAQPVAPTVQAPEASPALPAAATFARVSFCYGDASVTATSDALSEVDFAWHGREVLALTGPNGSGKSTCLRVLLRLATPSAGVVRVGGTDIARVDADRWRGRVAFLPQRPYLPPRTDVRATVAWPFPVDPSRDTRLLAELDRVGLREALARRGDPLAVRVDALSVGQRQRIALARLLFRDAEMFLLDEPDANLDRAGVALVAELVRELASRGMVAFAAHTPDLVAVADRVVTLEGGRVVSNTAQSPAITLA